MEEHSAAATSVSIDTKTATNSSDDKISEIQRADTKTATDSSDDEICEVEMQKFLPHQHDDLEEGNRAGGQAGAKTPESDLMRVWRPRLEFIVRLMLVATFLDDSLHTATRFSQTTKQIAVQGSLKWMANLMSPEIARIIATVAVCIALLAQAVGSVSLLALFHPDYATKALIGWSILQPVLYSQLSNVEFLAESVSLIGGLLVLRAHVVYLPRDPEGERTKLCGRLLLPAMSLYYAGRYLTFIFTPDETSSYAMYIAKISMVLLNFLAFVALVLGSMLVAAGLKSHLIALLFAVMNFGFVCYVHPLLRFVSYKGGEWKYSIDMQMPNVTVPKGVDLHDFTPEMIYDLHRYYFFLGLSSTGALLLLAQFGPGEISVEKDEMYQSPRKNYLS